METKCKKLEPLVTLEENGRSLVIDYNLPQINERNLASFINLVYPIEKDTGSSSSENQETPIDEVIPTPHLYWKDIFGFASWLLKESKKPSRSGLKLIPGLSLANEAGFYKVLIGKRKVPLTLNDADFLLKKRNPSRKNIGSIYLAGVSLNVVYQDLEANYIINVKKDKTGRFRYSKKQMKLKTPVRLKKMNNPTMVRLTSNKIHFFLKFHLKMLTYPGKIGMGKVVKTLSLLPGEEAELYSSNYLSNEKSRTDCENIIDSSSKSCEQDTYNTVKDVAQKNSSNSSSSKTYESEFWTDVDAKYWTIGVAGKGGVDVEGGFSSKSESISSAVEEMVSSFSEIVTSKANKSNQFRKYEIQTESYSKDISNTFKSVKRTIKNVNTSHVLNYYFRQLVQEYISITFMEGVTIMVPQHDKTLRQIYIGELSTYLKSQGVAIAQINEIIADIYRQLNNIYDYENKRWNLIEIVPRELVKLDLASSIVNLNNLKSVKNLSLTGFPGQESKLTFYKRIKKDIVTKYDGMSINGVIIDVTKRTLNTPSVIVESILGDGQALDCYTLQKRELEIKQKILVNKERELILDIIESIEDPSEKARVLVELKQEKSVESILKD